MGQTGIQWGGWSQKARLGVNYRYDDIGPGTTQSHVYADVYYGTNAWGYDGNYGLTCNFGNIGSFHFYSAGGASVTTLINTYDLGVQATSYSGGPSWTCTATLASALYDGGRPSVSAPFTLPARPPSPPDPPALGVDGITAASAHVFCTAAGAENGSTTDLINYRLYRTSSPAALIGDLQGGYSGVTFSGLTRAGTYDVYAQAHNGAGWGSFSGAYHFSTAATVPDAPVAPTVSSILPVSAVVAFSDPNNGGSGITSRDVQIARDAGFTTGVALFSGVTSPYTLTGLMPAGDYWVRVRANNAVGAGTWSPAYHFTTLPALYIGVGGVIKTAIPYVGVGNVPKMAIPYIGVGGVPKL